MHGPLAERVLLALLLQAACISSLSVAAPVEMPRTYGSREGSGLSTPIPRNVPVRLPPVGVSEVSQQPEAPPSNVLSTSAGTTGGDHAPAAKQQGDFVTRQQLDEALAKWSWKSEDFSVTPYGAFWADMLYATHRVDAGSYTRWVFSEQTQGEDALAIDARRSRFGLAVDGPEIGLFHGADSGGRLEIDFHGDFVTENRASVLLRHAYWEAKNVDFRLLVGQTWDVISPLSPGTINYASGLNAGNIGWRRTQFRGERYLELSPLTQITLQGALNQDIVTDFPTEAGVRREAVEWPVIEGRAALSLGPRDDDDCPPIEVGLSGHIGETGFDFIGPGPPPLQLPPEDDARFLTWSWNIDVRIPIGRNAGFQGELFHGSNLSAFLGGIGQGICGCERTDIQSTGGWVELWYDWHPCLHSHLGYSQDDPRDADFLVGRTYNQFLYANVIYDITKRMSTGLEVSGWRTLYQEQRVGLIPNSQLGPTAPGKAVTIDWMVKYEF